MDGFGFLLVGVFILLVMILVDRSKRNKERAEDRQLIRDLTTRIYFLEESVTKLKREAGTVAAKETTPVEPEVKATTPPKPAAPVIPVKPVVAPKPPQEVTNAWVKAPPSQVPLKTPTVAPPSPPVKPVEPPTTPVVPKPVVIPPPPPASAPHVAVPLPPVTPRFEAVQRKPAKPLKDQIRSFFNWIEEMLGEKWLGKIGISLVVLGIAGYLAAQVSNTFAGRQSTDCSDGCPRHSWGRHLVGTQRTLSSAGAVLDRGRMGYSVFPFVGNLQPQADPRHRLRNP